jgi:predicted ferric reductase
MSERECCYNGPHEHQGIQRRVGYHSYVAIVAFITGSAHSLFLWDGEELSLCRQSVTPGPESCYCNGRKL